MAQNAVNSEIVPMYVSLLGDAEAEVRSEAASKLVELASHCSANMIVQRILPQLKLQLATESSQHVKGSMAIAVSEMAQKLDQQSAETHLIPMISILLKNNSTEVVVSLISNLGPIVQVIGNGSIQDKLIPTLTTLTGDKTWRIRLAVVEFMATLANHIEAEVFVEKLQPLLLGMMGDSVFAIRDEVINSILKLSKGKFDQRWMENLLESKLEDFSKHEKFMMR
jgi:serine/threonine-protein phosphatase 2A regulatory subunit A